MTCNKSGAAASGGEIAMFLQRSDNPTELIPLDCYGLDGLDIDKGSIEQVLKRTLSPNSWEVSKLVRNAPDLTESNIMTDLTNTAAYLERINCAFNLFLTVIGCDYNQGLIENWGRAWILSKTEISRETLADMDARRGQIATIDQGFALAIPKVYKAYRGRTFDLTTSLAGNINSIAVCETEKCEGPCGASTKACQNVYSADDDGNVSVSTNGQASSATAGSTPFDVAEEVAAIVCIKVGGEERLIAARGTTDALAPAEIAYSDDNGTTWTNVDVGAVNGQFFPTSQSLFALDSGNIYLGTDDGYLYTSKDAGQTWTAIESGVIQVGAYNAVHINKRGYGYAVGAADVIVSIEDDVVTALTATGSGNALTTVWADSATIHVGTGSGNYYYTTNKTVTWTAGTFLGAGTGAVAHISFANPHQGILVHNTALSVGQLHTTICGGVKWERESMPNGVGIINDAAMCGTDRIYLAGETATIVGFFACDIAAPKV